MSPNTHEELNVMRARATMITRFLREACEKLEDSDQRCSNDTEESIYHEISLLNHMADTCVWSAASAGDRERESWLQDLESACARASKHFTRLYPRFDPWILAHPQRA